MPAVSSRLRKNKRGGYDVLRDEELVGYLSTQLIGSTHFIYERGLWEAMLESNNKHLFIGETHTPEEAGELVLRGHAENWNRHGGGRK